MPATLFARACFDYKVKLVKLAKSQITDSANCVMPVFTAAVLSDACNGPLNHHRHMPRIPADELFLNLRCKMKLLITTLLKFPQTAIIDPQASQRVALEHTAR